MPDSSQKAGGTQDRGGSLEELRCELAEARQELEEIQSRNRRVEQEKAWETSWTRRLVIVAATWLVAWLWLVEIGVAHAALQALVPSAAYAVSTLSLPVLKRLWVRIRFGPKSQGDR